MEAYCSFPRILGLVLIGIHLSSERLHSWKLIQLLCNIINGKYHQLYKINGQPTDYELPYHRTKKEDPVRISPSAKEE